MTISQIEQMPGSAAYRTYFKHVGKYQFKIVLEFRNDTPVLINGIPKKPRTFTSDTTYRSGKLLKWDFMNNYFKYANVNFTEAK